MLFNSQEYPFFLFLVFLLYWFIFYRDKKKQNTLLFLAGYVFYSFWDWRFLFIILCSTAINFLAGLRIKKNQGKKIAKKIFISTILINITLLFIFKYFDFFFESVSNLYFFLGFQKEPIYLKLIVPVGISFYTLHSLSYIADVYLNKIEPEGDFITYAVFINFFPLLIAGPIERATTLLPQLNLPRVFNYQQATTGLRLLLWGYFKKVVIADQCSIYVDRVYQISQNEQMHFAGSTILLAIILFSFQLYCDFSGYSDIATGSAKLLGINLIRNFKYPLFSQNIPELWKRWHISLTSWLRDYVYIPLGGSRSTGNNFLRNVSVVFILSGLWHGAGLNFIVWGLSNALLFFLYSIYPLKCNMELRNKNNINKIISIVFTVSLFSLTLIFFRSSGMNQAIHLFRDLFSRSLFNIPFMNTHTYLIISILIIFIYIEWQGRHYNIPIDNILAKLPRSARFFLYYLLLIIIWFYFGNERPFIYFQF
jgi:D-alanyl-lipoteichoic acid acyltransferase DltB (MBOAT superfamily)